MTALARPTEPWAVQPGWGIHVDLTPPELLNSRQLRILRKIIVTAVVAVVVLCAGGYVLATRDRSDAQSKLDAARLRTSQLLNDVTKYSTVTTIENRGTQIKSQIAALMTADVALPEIVSRIGGALPNGVAITNATTTISLAGVNGSATAGPTTDITSGHRRIGDVKLTGTASSLDAVSIYVDRLQAIKGIVDVVPTSNTHDDQGVQFTISLGLDDRLLSHRYDVSKGGK